MNFRDNFVKRFDNHCKELFFLSVLFCTETMHFSNNFNPKVCCTVNCNVGYVS